MNDRERLIELLKKPMCSEGDCENCEGLTNGVRCDQVYYDKKADHLISHGVTFERYGRWDDSGRYKFLNEGCIAIRCSECGCCLHEDEYRSYNWNYCPYCGAKMDEEET